MRNCDIIIPVFNAFKYLGKCLESVLIHTDLQNNRLIIINDNSDDERVTPFVEDFVSQKSKNIIFIKNECNLGFAKTVNIGIMLSDSDIILLDPFTEVTEDWLIKMQRCAYSKERVATVTPLSNDAGIVSVPAYNKASDIPVGYDLEKYQLFLDDISYSDYVDIPSGILFCLYIKREALDEVAFYDDNSFKESHYEISNFFYRCLDYGFRHILCDDVFINNEESQEFADYYRQTDEKEINVKEKKDYYNKCNAEKWQLHNPANYINKNICYNLCVNNGKSNVLFIIHLWESTPGNYKTIGGTSLHAFDIIRKLKYRYNFHVLAPFDGMYRLCSYWETGNDSMEIFSAASQYYINSYFNSDYSRMLDEITELFKIEIIHIHHMIGHYFDIIDIVKKRKVKIILSLHDYFSVCPRINKINYKNEYCGTQDNKECDLCIKSYENLNYNIKGINNIATWRKIWGLLFSTVDKIIAPSEATENEILQNYKNINIDVIEHGIDVYCEKKELDIDTDNEYHVAFIGFITVIKGKEIIENLIDYSKHFYDNVFFHLFGYMDSSIIRMKYRHFVNHGEYDRKDIDSLLINNKIKLVCIFSIWPEVFCYTLSESVSVNIPVLAIDMGAVGQRVRKNNLGWLIKNGTDIPEIYNKIKEIFSDSELYRSVTKSVSNYNVKNIDNMCSEYDRIYGDYKINTDNNYDLIKLKKFIKENYAISGKIVPIIENVRYLNGEINNRELHITQLIENERYINGELQKKTGHIEQLIISERQLKYNIDRLNDEINKIITSRSWKIVSRIFTFVDRLFPPESKRRIIMKLTINNFKDLFNTIKNKSSK